MQQAFRGFSPRLFDWQWGLVRHLADVLQPHRDTTGLSHRLITSLYLRLLLWSERADPSMVSELQLLRLKRVLRKADTTSWWHAYFTNSGFDPCALTRLEDLQKLAPITKQTLRNVSKDKLISRGTQKASLESRRTSGTTATPFEWATSKNDLFVEDTSYVYRMLSWYGALPTKRRSGRAIFGSFVATNFCTPAIQFFWNPASDNATEEFLAIVNRIRKEGLAVLFFYSTHLILFSKKVAETGVSHPFKLIITGGQELDDAYRDYIQGKFKCPVALLYGATELEHLAVECPASHDRYHLNAERVLLEILDDQGQPVPEGGEGLITFTSLQNIYMPLIRYQLGDRGRIIPGPCPCGKTLPRFEFRGREADFIRLPGGERLLFQMVNRVLLGGFFADMEFYQLEQRSLDTLVVRTKLKPGVNKKRFETQLLPKLHACTKNKLRIVFEYPDVWNMDAGRKLKTIIPLAR